ncbi:6-hydroxymethylpterin diphosphokinase MptE-like protein [Maridesulfovibrio sp. FT414]|uniref:6-hydroxymethylpterin diphosphokinase MptE-like protein n=1 Tax=Maridesulfovibrio sp. FT414 TaxID=2979469 RepID=UPI003D80A103
MFKTLLDDTKCEDDGSFYFFFATTRWSNIPRRRKCSFTNVDATTFSAIQKIQLKNYIDGITIVLDSDTYPNYKIWIDQIQRYLAYVYCKYILFPQKSATIPDLIQARKSSPSILIPRELQRAQNIPTYLKYPLCDKLEAAGIQKPVTIILPGPSLNECVSLLPEIREKTLIVCVPRSIDFCRKNGVEPDFVINLDTAPRMKLLLRNGSPMTSTYLVALSPGPIAEVESHYKGIFFMDSFDPGILKNDYRLRESWLSCAIAALGFAELIKAPKVFILGADHSWKGEMSPANAYWNGNDGALNEAKYDQTRPVLVENLYDKPNPHGNADFSSFLLADRNGNYVNTYFHYFATSVELEYTAIDISHKHNTEFYLLRENGILPKNIFKTGGIRELTKLPPIDRLAISAITSLAAGEKEIIDFEKLILGLKKQAETLRKEISIMQFQYCEGNVEHLLKHPYVESLRTSSKQNKFNVFEIDTLTQAEINKLTVATTIRVCNIWFNHCEAAIRICRFHKAITSKENIILWCASIKDGEELYQKLESRHGSFDYLLFCLNDHSIQLANSSELHKFARNPGMMTFLANSFKDKENIQVTSRLTTTNFDELISCADPETIIRSNELLN